jgi:hypothetical protein
VAANGAVVKVFISYRRTDTAAVTGRIFDRLRSHFGPDKVFMDVDSVPFGVDFRWYIRDSVTRCNVMLAVIGKEWLTRGEDGKCKLEDPSDFVRVELEIAFQQGIPVIPVLVDRVTMPKQAELPECISDLAFRNAAEINTGRDFHFHMDRLVRQIHLLKHGPSAPPSGEIRPTSMDRMAEWSKRFLKTKPAYSRPPSKFRRYTLLFWPKSAIGWVLRIIFAWSFIGSVVFLSIVFQEGLAGDTRKALSILLPSAVIAYLVAVISARPRD